EPIPPRKLNRQVPRELERVCLQCLEKKPADRYPTAAALAEDLGRFLAGQPVTARATPPGRKSRFGGPPVAVTSPPPAGSKRKSRTRRFVFAGILAGLVTAILLALIVVVIYYWRPVRYPELVVVGPNPGGSLAAIENSGGSNAAKALAEWAGQGDNRPRLVAPAAETADKDAWPGKLDKNAQSIRFYFSAQGGADANGAFLWFIPADAKTPSDAHKLRVKDILARLEGLPKDQPKLLIFDAARLPASWPHGMLFNDFARALKELDGEIAKVGGLVVICSSDADERAWSSEEFRSSVFGHFVVEGLKGAAGKQPGERTAAARIFDYVSTEVTRWAFANRDEKQTPILLPANGGRERAEAIELSVVPVGGYTKPALPERPGKVPDDLKAAWETAVDLAGRTPAPDTLDPGKWREYLDLLIRWERLGRLGGDPEPVRARAVVLGAQLKA